MPPAPEELEVLEGDEGEPEIGRHRDVGREVLATPLSDLKRAPAVTVPPTATVARAVELMRRRGAGAVLVVERRRGKARLAGIFTERDLVERALAARSWARAPVRRFMTPDPETLRGRDAVAYALEKMSVGRFGHVPIVDDDGSPAGIVSLRELVDFLVELCPEEILNLPPEPELALHPRAEGD
jgi:CBS domain-containing protein